MATIASLNVALTADSAKYRKELDTAAKRGKRFQRNQVSVFKRIQDSVFNLRNALGGIFAGLSLAGIARINGQFQDLRTSLSAVLSPSQDVGAAFDALNKFSLGTQFNVEQLTQAYIKLAANGIQPTEELLTTFTDAASVSTDQLGSLQAITDLYTRSLQSQTVTLEDLERLADRGLPVYDILREKLGLARGEILEFSREAGNTTLVLDALAEGIQERFGGQTAAIAQNFTVSAQNLNSAFRGLADTVGGQFTPILADAFNRISAFINENQDLARSIGQGIGSAIQFVIDNVKILVQVMAAAFSAAIAVQIVNIANAAIKLAQAFRTAAIAGTILQGVTGVGLVKALAGIAGAAGAVVAIDKIFESAAGNAKQLEQNVKGVGEAIEADLEIQVPNGLDDIGIANQSTLGQGGEEPQTPLSELQTSVESTLNTLLPLRSATNQYFDDLEILREALDRGAISGQEYNQAIEALDQRFDEFTTKQADNSRSFTDGWTNAVNQYVDDATNGAKQAEQIFQTASKGMEDALVGFVTTGKLSFKDLANSLISDILRMQAKAATSKIFESLNLGGGGTGGGLSSLVSQGFNYVKGFFQDGGIVPGNYSQPVPIMAHGNEMVLNPQQQASLFAMANGSGGGGGQTFNINVQGDVSRQTREEIVRMIPEITYGVNATNKEQGI